MDNKKKFVPKCGSLSSIENIDSKNKLLNLLNAPTKKISDVLFGLIKADRSDLADTTHRLFTGILKNDLILELGKVIEHYRKKGEIKEDYLENDFNRMSLKEIFNIIDSDPPDEIKFKAIKSVFLSGVATSAKEGDEMLAYQYLSLLKRMDSGEILTLKTAYAIKNAKKFDPGFGQPLVMYQRNWPISIVNNSAISYKELVQLYEEILVGLKLLYPYDLMSDDTDGRNRRMTFRLTDLGISLCEFITNYDKDKKG